MFISYWIGRLDFLPYLNFISPLKAQQTQIMLVMARKKEEAGYLMPIMLMIAILVLVMVFFKVSNMMLTVTPYWKDLEDH